MVGKVYFARMNKERNAIALMTLVDLPGIGPQTIKKILEKSNQMDDLFNLSKRRLMHEFNLPESQAKTIAEAKQFDQSKVRYESINAAGVTITAWNDPDYPRRLLRCNDAPVLLYGKGNRIWNAPRTVAVVGMRQASEYGKRMCKKIVQEMVPYNPVIISGLAFGIDITAHRTALKTGLKTMACLAHGLDIVYPSAHAKEARLMQETGMVCSEHELGVKPDRVNFPLRNRLIAGMADVVVVVESTIKGGSMLTAKLAHSYHRDVMAVPTRVGDEKGEGCFELIQHHLGSLITGGDDVARFMNWDISQPVQQTELLFDLNEHEKEVLRLLSNEDLHIDDLTNRFKSTRGDLMVTLFKMELSNLVRGLKGSRWTRVG